VTRRRFAFALLCCAVACDDAAVRDKVVDAGSSFDGQSTDVAVKAGCPPGSAGCKGGSRWVCNDQGTGFVESPCTGQLLCSDGQCVQCTADAPCAGGLACLQGSCQAAPLQAVTTALPAGLVGTPYKAELEAKGGTQPYAWSLVQGALPAGLTLQPPGAIEGVPQAAGAFTFGAQVQDKHGAKAIATLALEVKAGGLVVTSASPLKAATDGEPYSLALGAQGGKPPYFWGVAAGKLPVGLSLGSDGTLAGVPQGEGDYPFDVKVFDNGDAPLVASKALVLPVKLAPLEIVGDQSLNLILTKVIVLPLILVVEKVPVPYNAKLQAKGGKKPYAWSETPLPGMVKNFLPNAGLPNGLALAKDGALSGAVTDASQVLEFKVPLSQLTLKGFFFAAQVQDSQAKPQTKQAVFIIPTVPVGAP